MAILMACTQPLREEHKALRPEIDQLRTAADRLGEESSEASWYHVDALYRFLTYHILPHAAAEETVLYPAVGNLLGAEGATATMIHDHVEIRQLTEQLGAVRPRPSARCISREEITELRRILYGLHTLLTAHLNKEEQIYFPLLDARLTNEEAYRMFQAMEQAAIEAKLQLGTGDAPPLD